MLAKNNQFKLRVDRNFFSTSSLVKSESKSSKMYYQIDKTKNVKGTVRVVSKNTPLASKRNSLRRKYETTWQEQINLGIWPGGKYALIISKGNNHQEEILSELDTILQRVTA